MKQCKLLIILMQHLSTYFFNMGSKTGRVYRTLLPGKHVAVARQRIVSLCHSLSWLVVNFFHETHFLKKNV